MNKTIKTSTALVAIAAAALITPQIANAALMAHWSMDGGTVPNASPATLSDVSGNGYDLNKVGSSTTYATGVSGTGLQTPTYQEVVASGNSALALEGVSAVTLSAWVWLKGDDSDNDFTGSQGIAGFSGTGTGSDSYAFTTTGNGMRWSYFADNQRNLDANFTPDANGAWYHFVGVYEDGVGGAIYVNGVLASSNTTTTDGKLSSTRTGLKFDIGTYTNSASYTSKKLQDDVQVYDEALTLPQIQSLYNNPGSVIPEPSTTALLGLGGLALILRRRK